MYNPVHVSNNFLVRSFSQGVPVTAMKMQKMLYFLYRDYLKETGIALFSERFSAWPYGPVLESVYHTYKDFGANRIKNYGGTPVYSLMEEDDPHLAGVISRIWNRSLPYDGIELSRLTHHLSGAWYQAWRRNYPFLLDEDILQDNVEII